jgi:hypothetical protein
MLSKEYTMTDKKPITGMLNSSPSSITQVNGPSANKINLSYSLYVPDSNFTRPFVWKLNREVGTVTETIFQGDHLSTDLSAVVEDPVALNTLPGDRKTIKYSLEVIEGGVTKVIATALTNINVPALVKEASVGYLDAAIMSYVDSDGVRRKIGSLGTAQDAVEFKNRVPMLAFTRKIPMTYLDTETFINAPVYNPTDTVKYVHFMAIIPQEWGPVDFYQTLGLVDAASFYKIDLGDGTHAYLYHVAPSAVTNPSDYYIKRK